MPGHIIEGTTIAVDLWKNIAAVRYFFLSHLHADHTVGLTRNWEHRIYTSPGNAELINLKGLVMSSLIRPLAIGEGHTLPLKKDKGTFTVTLLDANHCPGSVMFLFEGSFGNILYTGDFCYSPNTVPRNLPTIDTLYLDNTYCSDKCEFPPREEATKEAVKTLLGCLRSSQLVIVGIDSLGKEELIVRLAEAAKMKIYMEPERASVFGLLGLENITTSDPSETKIHIRPTRLVSRKNVDVLNRLKPTCGILATSRFMDSDLPREKRCPSLHTVAYSCHSSYSGLRSFVKEIKPKKIIPIIDANVRGIGGKDISERADMSVFDDLCRSGVRNEVRPTSEEQPHKRPRRSVFDDSCRSGARNKVKPISDEQPRKRPRRNLGNVPKSGHLITCVSATGKRVYHVPEGMPSVFDVLFKHLK